MHCPEPIWAEVNLSAIAHNVEIIKNTIGNNTKLMAIVKANAYGHGAEQVALTALEHGAAYLGVARLSEGESLRRAGIDAPILILGYTPPENYPTLLTDNLTQTVYSLAMAEELDGVAVHAGAKAVVHVKVDTGMGRLGFRAGPEAEREIVAVASLPHLTVEGIFTHFAAADNPESNYTLIQLKKFTKILDDLEKLGLTFSYRHAANSAALIDLSESHLDLVRPGIAIYGADPLPVERRRLDLIPAMTVKARVTHVKNVPAGTGISYGVTCVTTGKTKLATVSAGYADGYNRLLSNKGEVLLHGQRAKVVGRVCMDQMVVDVGNITDVAPGDEVVLLGRQYDAEIRVEEIAEKIMTIPNEVFCAISSRVPRYYVHWSGKFEQHKEDLLWLMMHSR